jgi:hypothetical protein
MNNFWGRRKKKKGGILFGVEEIKMMTASFQERISF